MRNDWPERAVHEDIQSKEYLAGQVPLGRNQARLPDDSKEGRGPFKSEPPEAKRGACARGFGGHIRKPGFICLTYSGKQVVVELYFCLGTMTQSKVGNRENTGANGRARSGCFDLRVGT